MSRLVTCDYKGAGFIYRPYHPSGRKDGIWALGSITVIMVRENTGHWGRWNEIVMPVPDEDHIVAVWDEIADGLKGFWLETFRALGIVLRKDGVELCAGQSKAV